MDVLANAGVLAPRLHIKLHNEIPLGMGCGSSAAALLAGILLANHFGGLNLSSAQILEEACRREGHPDNVAACYLGGMTVSSATPNGIATATFGKNLDWNLILTLPSAGLATSKARALLPSHYSREDTVANIQSTAPFSSRRSPRDPAAISCVLPCVDRTPPALPKRCLPPSSFAAPFSRNSWCSGSCA